MVQGNWAILHGNSVVRNLSPSSATPRIKIMRIECNGQWRSASDQTTVAGLLRELGLESQHVAVEINEQVVPRAEHDECFLRDGDRLEIVTLVGGG